MHRHIEMKYKHYVHGRRKKQYTVDTTRWVKEKAKKGDGIREYHIKGAGS